MPSPLRDRDFRLLWAGQTASQLAAHSSQLTLPLIAVVTVGASAAEVGALRAVQQAPILLLSLFVGAWVDRRRTRRVLILSDLGRAAAMAALPAAYALGVLRLPVLAAVALLLGALTVCFDVTYQAALVRHVPRVQLTTANSALEGSRSAAQIAGPGIGGGVMSLASAPVAALLSAVSFGASALFIRAMHRDGSPADERAAGMSPDAGGAGPPMRRRIAEGLRLVAREPVLRSVGIASALFQFSFAALMTVYVLYLPRELGLSGAAVGLILAALGPGALVGSWLAAVLPGRRLRYGLVLVSSAVIADGAILCVLTVTGSGTTATACLMAVNFLFGVASQLVDISVTAVRQAITPIALQGRVVATINVVGMGLTPLGSLLGGALAAQFGLRTGMTLTAVALALSPLFMALSPLARLGRELPTPASQH
ncbi:MFS transporter [Streptomyces boninensis]|uniref:MFS transporter n=1 Tax=Streptomyces boninensis TaxID=2039455 RepID=UPI003B220700